MPFDVYSLLNQSFAVFMAVYLVTRMEKTIGKNTEVVGELKGMIASLCEKKR
jgi:hypothetical protein